tara:strand:+ start:455 stop:697 length:243 start_codon:yes stop_codon:yes gene_type:complete
MCFGGRPKPPPLPTPAPDDSPIEETAQAPTLGSQGGHSSKKKKGKTATGKKVAAKKRGTSSLQIPKLPESDSSGDLNYTT